MTFLRNAVLSVAAFGFLAAVPLTAHALEVECELRDGSSCTVSNDDDDFISCACEDGSGTAGTGGDDWADFDEEQLMEVCLAETVQCSAGGTDGG
ncbi:MAG: MYXO-CTERM domain-containing protein, partial [Nannocystaceae bacterium]|nr:MYXO-CTERM domain-containing protein [Nannocystaceae bacterium]